MVITCQPRNKLKCFYTNANSLTNKVEELRIKASQIQYHIMAITETWCHRDILDAEISIDGYTLYRKDRGLKDCSRGGGVLIYIKETCQSRRLEELETEDQETLWCAVGEEPNILVVGVCYRRPSALNTPEDEEQLLLTLERADNYRRNKRLLLMGDFNFPDAEHSTAARFHDKIQDLFWYQHILENTRNRGTQSSLLDLIFSDEEDNVDDIVYGDPLGRSDHVCIEFNFHFRCDELVTEQNWKRNYVKGNYDIICRKIKAIDWKGELIRRTTEEAWNYFKVQL